MDVAPADGASIQQTLKLLEEKLKSVGKQDISAFQTHILTSALQGEERVIPFKKITKKAGGKDLMTSDSSLCNVPLSYFGLTSFWGSDLGLFSFKDVLHLIDIFVICHYHVLHL